MKLVAFKGRCAFVARGMPGGRATKAKGNEPRPLTSHRCSFDEVDRAFRMMQTKEGGTLKPLILFEGSTFGGGGGT